MVVLWFIIGILIPVAQGMSRRNDAEYKLREKLLNNYTNYCHSNWPVKVDIGIALTNLMSMDVQKEEVSLNIWLRITWNDSDLTWNPSEYSNISQIRMLMEDIWTPDVFLYFATGKIQEFGKNIPGSLKFGAFLSNEGKLFFSQPTTIHALCAVDIAYFPFDDQFCNLTFGSWSHDVEQVDIHLHKTAVDQSSYSKHNEWQIMSAEATREVVVDSYSNTKHPRAVLKLHLRRNALFYMVNYVLPSVIIAVLSLLVFLIPPEVGKRMEAGINLLLCLSVYLMLVNSKMPITSKSFPLLTKFYGCTIVLLVVSLCCSCWVYSFYFVNPSGWDVYHIPKWLQVLLFEYLHPVLYWSANRKKVAKVEPASQESSEIKFENIQLEPETFENHVELTDQNKNQDKIIIHEKPLTEEKAFVVEQPNKRTSNTIKRSQPNIIDSPSAGSQNKGKSSLRRARNAIFIVKRMEEDGDAQSIGNDNQGVETETLEDNSEVTTSASKETEKIPPSTLRQDPHMMYVAESAQMDQQKFLNKEKWKLAAMILNRFFIVLLIISIMASFLGCFFSSPRVRNNLY